MEHDTIPCDIVPRSTAEAWSDLAFYTVICTDVALAFRTIAERMYRATCGTAPHYVGFRKRTQYHVV